MSPRQTLAGTTKSIVPKPLRSLFRHLYLFTLDSAEVILGQRDSLTPPERLRVATGPNRNFKETGQSFLNFLIERCELKPNERVLDVGCGVGRIAIALANYLNSNGHYEGFDIVRAQIDWCKRNISPRFPNFRFQLADIYNKAYNPEGKCIASEYRFPFDDESFDLVILASVFTHMLPPDMERYLGEISRVLKRGARAVISFYLLNDEARRNIDTKLSMFTFKFEVNGCWVQNVSTPESCIAYEEEHVRYLFEKHGLRIMEPILYGTWSRVREQMQDIIIVSKV